MGYTHYWAQRKPITDAQWDALVSDLGTLYRESMATNLVKPGTYPVIQGDTANSPPSFEATGIRFNGQGEDGHETFLVLPHLMNEMQFCKTAAKPYDLWVVAALCLVGFRMPECFEFRSDDTGEEWQPGLALARNIQPTVRRPKLLSYLGSHHGRPY